MPPAGLVLAISGPVCAGKTTLADNLKIRGNTEVLSTRALLVTRASTAARAALQQCGDKLDREEGGSWVATPVAELRRSLGSSRTVIVDAVRTLAQVTALRQVSGEVVHIHLTAADAILARRYEAKAAEHPELELANYDAVRRHPTEGAVRALDAAADLILDTGVLAIPETLDRVSQLLKDRS